MKKVQAILLYVWQLPQNLLGLPYDQMILYPTFVHFSHRLEGSQRGQVLYNRRYNGRKNHMILQ